MSEDKKQSVSRKELKDLEARVAQGIALAEALVPRTAEDRMIGNLVLDAELAKPPVGKIDPRLSANPSL
jgi:hypothetical protein